MLPIPDDILAHFNAVLAQKSVPSTDCMTTAGNGFVTTSISELNTRRRTHSLSMTVKEAKSPLDF